MKSFLVGFRFADGKFEEHHLDAYDFLDAVEQMYYSKGFNSVVPEVVKPLSVWIKER